MWGRAQVRGRAERRRRRCVGAEVECGAVQGGKCASELRRGSPLIPHLNDRQVRGGAEQSDSGGSGHDHDHTADRRGARKEGCCGTRTGNGRVAATERCGLILRGHAGGGRGVGGNAASRTSPVPRQRTRRGMVGTRKRRGGFARKGFDVGSPEAGERRAASDREVAAAAAAAAAAQVVRPALAFPVGGFPMRPMESRLTMQPHAEGGMVTS
eukprot:355084-Chlamydomonas_euryale.AAC.1